VVECSLVKAGVAGTVRLSHPRWLRALMCVMALLLCARGAGGVRVPNPSSGAALVLPPSLFSNATARALLQAGGAPAPAPEGVVEAFAERQPLEHNWTLFHNCSDLNWTSTHHNESLLHNCTGAGDEADEAFSLLGTDKLLIGFALVASFFICFALLPTYWFPCPSVFGASLFSPLIFGMGPPNSGTTIIVAH